MSWTHCRLIICVSDPKTREFFIQEVADYHWNKYVVPRLRPGNAYAHGSGHAFWRLEPPGMTLPGRSLGASEFYMTFLELEKSYALRSKLKLNCNERLGFLGCGECMNRCIMNSPR